MLSQAWEGWQGTGVTACSRLTGAAEVDDVVGSAMFTIVASSTTISWARATTARISQRRGSAPVTAGAGAGPRAGPGIPSGRVRFDATAGVVPVCAGAAALLIMLVRVNAISISGSTPVTRATRQPAARCAR